MCIRLLKRQIAAVAIGLLVTGAATNADEQDMSVTVHSGYGGATEILNGNFAAGERRTSTELSVAERKFNPPSVVSELLNNLCVSQIMQHNTIGALDTCDRAVHRAERTPPEGRQTRASIRKLQAIAYLNRGVSRALSQDTEQAIDDFNAALRLRPEFDEAAKNLAVAQFTTGRPTVVGLRKQR